MVINCLSEDGCYYKQKSSRSNPKHESSTLHAVRFMKAIRKLSVIKYIGNLLEKKHIMLLTVGILS